MNDEFTVYSCLTNDCSYYKVLPIWKIFATLKCGKWTFHVHKKINTHYFLNFFFF